MRRFGRSNEVQKVVGSQIKSIYTQWNTLMGPSNFMYWRSLHELLTRLLTRGVTSTWVILGESCRQRHLRHVHAYPETSFEYPLVVSTPQRTVPNVIQHKWQSEPHPRFGWSRPFQTDMIETLQGCGSAPAKNITRSREGGAILDTCRQLWQYNR